MECPLLRCLCTGRFSCIWQRNNHRPSGEKRQSGTVTPHLVFMRNRLRWAGRLLGVCISSTTCPCGTVLCTLRASLSGTFLQRKDAVNQCLEFECSVDCLQRPALESSLCSIDLEGKSVDLPALLLLLWIAFIYSYSPPSIRLTALLSHVVLHE